MTRYRVAGSVAAAVLVVLAACSGAEGAPEGAGAASAAQSAVVLGPRDIAVATRTDLVAGLPVSGDLEPGVDVRLAAPIAEVLTEVLVKEGQRVARGAVLARFRADVVRPAALSAEAQRRVAQADYERMQNLFKEGAVSERDVDAALVSLRAAEAAEAMARQRLAESEVRAPVAGTIAVRHVTAGDRVQEGDPLFQLVSVRELEFAAAVPSQYALEVRVGAPVALVVTGFPGAVSGRVARVNATADPATRQLQVYVTVPNASGRLVGGLFASGRIVLREAQGALAIPRAGLRSDGDGTYALVVAGDTLARRAVTAGVRDEVQGLVEIRSGLSAGDRVVVSAGEGLAPGQPVAVAGGEG
jgi:RND family efflux transporter MFP subunit